MRAFQPTYRRNGEQHTSPTWHVRFKDHRNIWRRVPAFTDKAMSEELGRKIDKLVATIANHERPTGDQARWLENLRPDIRDRLARWRVIDDRMSSASKPLTAHVNDFHASLLAKGNTAAHADLVKARASKLIGECHFTFWADVSASKVERVLSTFREDTAEQRGISRQTSNFYLQAAKQFARWMVADGRAGESPVAHLKALNVRTDRRHDRRALTADELQRLVTATYHGPVREGRRFTSNSGKPTWLMTGPERAALYLVSMATLARHSTITLTMNRYTHTMREAEQDAVATLPEIDLDAPDEQRATGTDGGACHTLDIESGAHRSLLSPSGQGCYDSGPENAVLTRTGGGAVERAGLENRYALRGIVGSNPTLSALFDLTK